MTEQYTPYRKGTILAQSGSADHLHIVCSDPIYSPEHGCDVVLIVNVSSVPSVGRFDDSCVLDVGDHVFIRHPSYLVYSRSVLWRCPTLMNKVDSGEYRVHADVDEPVMQRIVAGFSASEQTPFKIFRFVQKNLTS